MSVGSGPHVATEAIANGATLLSLQGPGVPANPGLMSGSRGRLEQRPLLVSSVRGALTRLETNRTNGRSSTLPRPWLSLHLLANFCTATAIMAFRTRDVTPWLKSAIGP
jgi:hypothetical protein